MVRLVAFAALLALPVTAVVAQDAPIAGQPPAKIRSITLTPGDKCPESANGEIVVCQTLEEPYRIPKSLRKLAPSAANLAWGSRVEGLDEVGREGGGLPNTCSPTGSGGQTGCTQQLIDKWQAERRAPK
ncbi:hypothetical protein [Sphingomonas sp. 28-63-12]|uniref:hypothetical protein n=1 Tax=Sphingomonas sp. 28-63-12 TaxID=1970434 RepID=UPI000BC83169|nr:MAG: hypothetical protein B7Y47_12785 [Sphingomonas sp. 28-63-12]